MISTGNRVYETIIIDLIWSATNYKFISLSIQTKIGFC